MVNLHLQYNVCILINHSIMTSPAPVLARHLMIFNQSTLVNKFSYFSVPCKVTNLIESGATYDNVSASWTAPVGVYGGYNVTCSDESSLLSHKFVDNTTTMVTCADLPTCGADYTITVMTLSGDKESEPCQITITSCK